ncbi:alpha-ketoglutarate-dependent sulfonate dioxygenase [Verticillium dahliae]
MAHLEARKHISPDSGFPITLHPSFNKKIRDHVPPDSLREEIKPEKDRAHFADPSKKALLSVAKQVDLTESIGTLLEGVQLSQLSPEQLDELAALVTERGVVFFRNQDLTTDGQVKLFEHYGVLDKHPAQKDVKHVVIKGSREDHREILNYTPWPGADFHADTSFEINPPSYSLLRMEEHPAVGGDTTWVSQYGLYDALSDAYKKFINGLHAVHTSRLQYDSILDLWGVGPNRPPIDSHHPAVRTHPVTGLKALNVNPGFVTGFAELKKVESDKLLDFFAYHIHSADDHAVRWKWDVGSVAMWDNRATIHRVIPGTYEAPRRGIRTTVFGEKPYLDPASESRNQRAARLKAAIQDGKTASGGGLGSKAPVGESNKNSKPEASTPA